MQAIEAEVGTGSTVMTCSAKPSATGAANNEDVRFNAVKHCIVSWLAVLAQESFRATPMYRNS